MSDKSNNPTTPNYALALISCLLLTRVSRAASIRTIALYCSYHSHFTRDTTISLPYPSSLPLSLSLSLSFSVYLRGAARFDRSSSSFDEGALRPVVSDLIPEIARARDVNPARFRCK
jgi:hypothetical protein